jgi:DNA-binding Lrp family transcriptional regulator
VDPVDFAVYRYLSPGGEARFWAGRRTIDPTLPAREIARHVGLSENAVRSRLRGLADRGYLRGSAVVPNPSLFDARVFVVEIPVRTPADADRLFHDLALVEGVVFARDTLDEGDRRVRVHFVSDRDPTTARRSGLLARLASAGAPLVPTVYAIPPCDAELTPLDWRVLATRMRHPDADLGELAGLVHLSPKTTARRQHRLIGSRAFWWTHSPESEEFPLALLRVRLRDPGQRGPVTRRLEEHATAWMPVASDGLGLEREAAAKLIAGLVPADAPTALERTVKEVSELAGVEEVQRTFPLGSRSYPTWFVERVNERLPLPR